MNNKLLNKISAKDLAKSISQHQRTVESILEKDPEERYWLDLEGYDLRGQTFEGEDLRLINFSNSDLSGSNFNGSDLTRSKFENTNMNNTSFENAILFGAYLPNANMTNAQLQYAQLRKSFLKGTNLRNANMEKAIFGYTDYEFMDDESVTHLMDLEYDESTIREGTRVINAKFFDVKELGKEQTKRLIQTVSDAEKYEEYKKERKQRVHATEEVENRGEERINSIKTHFESLQTNHQQKSKYWFRGSIVLLLTMLYVVIKSVEHVTLSSNLNHTYFYQILPLFLFLSSVLYFCIRQYLQYNRYYLENNDKIALIEGYFGLLDTNDPNIEFFAAKTAEHVFTVGNKKSSPILLDTVLKNAKTAKDLGA